MCHSVLTYALLCLSAFAAGVVNSLAGGGTLLTFPVLLAVLSSVEANATSTVALMPGSAAAAWGYRRELRDTRQWLRLLALPSLLGGLLGSLLLVWLPGRVFDFLIPWLLLSAGMLFLFQPLVAKAAPSERPIANPGTAKCCAVVCFQTAVAVYGGYFGAGIGILMLAALAFMGLGDIHRMNAVKSFLAFLINGISVVVFAAEDVVAWQYGVAMAGAGIAGGFCGAHFGRRLPRAWVRWFVIIVGFSLAAHYFLRQATSRPD